MSNSDIELCYKLIAYESIKYKTLRDEGKVTSAEMIFQSKSGMERLLAALLAQTPGKKSRFIK